MRDTLAERLLAETMGWRPREVAQERPYLQAMAAYKYDEYQQFSPGIRFLESLALWLRQFEADERPSAYEFVKRRLFFCSSAEMGHLVQSAFPDLIRPLIIGEAGKLIGVPEWKVATITASPEYRALRRRSLFLGLSDGAHIDVFRRANPELSHEQIYLSYEVTDSRAHELKTKLAADLAEIPSRGLHGENAAFRFLFLLDDFSASGTSYLRKDETGVLDGKLAKINKALYSEREGLGSLVNPKDLCVCLVLYMATRQAIEALTTAWKLSFTGPVNWTIRVEQELGEEIRLSESSDAPFLALCDSYYDASVETEHMRKGKTDARRGFAACAVPLILSHNSPNNAPFLLWSDPERYQVRGLFPRVERHRE